MSKKMAIICSSAFLSLLKMLWGPPPPTLNTVYVCTCLPLKDKLNYPNPTHNQKSQRTKLTRQVIKDSNSGCKWQYIIITRVKVWPATTLYATSRRFPWFGLHWRLLGCGVSQRKCTDTQTVNKKSNKSIKAISRQICTQQCNKKQYIGLGLLILFMSIREWENVDAFIPLFDFKTRPFRYHLHT